MRKDFPACPRLGTASVGVLPRCLTGVVPRRLDAGMSDLDLHSGAWHVPPGRYLADRPPEFGLPAAPASRYLAMRDGCRLAVDVWLPQRQDYVVRGLDPASSVAYGVPGDDR